MRKILRSIFISGCLAAIAYHACNADGEHQYSTCREGRIDAESKIICKNGKVNFSGVGLVITTDEDGTSRIYSIIPGTPSEKAGFLAGDRLISIDGVLTSSMTLRAVVLALRGEVGSKVQLVTSRAGVSDPMKYEITRQALPKQD